MALWYLSESNGRQLLPIQFFDADLHIMRQHEIEEDLLLAVEVGADLDLGLRGPFLAGQRRQRVGDVRQHVEEVALFGVDDLLHLRHLIPAEAFFGQALQ